MSPRAADHEAVLTVRLPHRLFFTRDALGADGATLAATLPAPGCRVLAFADEGLAEAWPELPQLLQQWAAAQAPPVALVDALHLLPGGEQAKNDPSVFETVLQRIAAARLCRRSCVLVLGGGAVLDVVGFAASVAHRGLSLVRLPSTSLAQGDSGVGVKNGINAFDQKNFLGTFAVPGAVVNDAAMLETLPPRAWRAGFAEVVKVGLAKEPALLERLEASAAAIADGDVDAGRPLLERSAALHFQHIAEGGDPFEHGKARPLDLGHWAAHRLERLTDFALQHGEAVAIGLALDAHIAHAAGWLSAADAERVLALLRNLGLPLYHEALEREEELMEGVEQFREHLGGPLAIPMAAGLGALTELEHMNPAQVQKAVAALRAHATTGSAG
jgi:3-dehydroquinate synthase